MLTLARKKITKKMYFKRSFPLEHSNWKTRNFDVFVAQQVRLKRWIRCEERGKKFFACSFWCLNIGCQHFKIKRFLISLASHVWLLRKWFWKIFWKVGGGREKKDLSQGLVGGKSRKLLDQQLFEFWMGNGTVLYAKHFLIFPSKTTYLGKAVRKWNWFMEGSVASMQQVSTAAVVCVRYPK